jgi:hypothetical protein
MLGDQPRLREHDDVGAPGRAGSEGGRDVVAERDHLDRVVEPPEPVEHAVEGAQLLAAPAHGDPDAPPQPEDVRRTGAAGGNECGGCT